MRFPVLATMIALGLLAPALAAPGGGGHWEILGEDGAIWVPDEPPAATYLPPPGLGSYHDWNELSSALQALATAHPDLAQVSTLGVSVEGRDIWAVTLHAGADDGDPAVLFDGAHHGDEVIASEILLRYAQTLAAEYPSTQRSRVLDNVTIVIVPMVNPDGIMRAHTATNYADARKNAHSVDLNRNYAFKWGGTGSSGSPSDATYRGPSAASEPETQAMQALLNSRAWTFYSSLHSGAEMILWPWGWTTASPPENTMYQTLGSELTAITGAPNGQVSKILYGVSGDSMDHAYGGPLPGWRPVATSPETYEGSGSAFDWWLLFNPPETESAIAPVVARWSAFLDHLAAQATSYQPATLALPAGHAGGAEAFALDALVTPPSKRPILGAVARVEAPAFLGVTTANPLALGTISAPRTASWTLAPSSGGIGNARVTLDAGAAGNLTGLVPIEIIAPAVSLSLDRASARSGETANATVTFSTDRAIEATATLAFAGATLDTRNVTLSAGDSLSWTVQVPVGGAPAGAQTVDATIAYPEGSITARATLTIERPQLTVTRGAPATTPVGQPFVMNVTVRNTGTLAAYAPRLTELVPQGYALVPREVGVPVSAEPITRPAPKETALAEDGRLALTWTPLGIVPGGTFSYQMRLVALEPGAHLLETALDYEAKYPAGRTYDYVESRTQAQMATVG